MGNTTIERAITLLEDVLVGTEDEDQRFKLRTALQLLEVIENRHDAASEVLADTDIDAETRENLQQLGYLTEVDG